MDIFRNKLLAKVLDTFMLTVSILLVAILKGLKEANGTK